MARLIEESSDDEFPDLADLVKNVEVGKGKKDGGADNGRSTRKGGGQLEKGEWIEKKKKRLLNQASENPFLRPFGTISSSREGSEALGGKPKEKARSLKSGSSKQSAPEKKSEVLSNASKEGKEESESDVGRKPRRTALVRKPQLIEPSSESEEEIVAFDDSDNLSDFIVDDASILEEDESVLEPPPPRSTRKLVRGRKPKPSFQIRV